MSVALLVVHPSGITGYCGNAYEDIKAAMGGVTIDIVRVAENVMLIIDDDGMLNGGELNVPVGFCVGAALYGTIIVCGPDGPDERPLEADPRFVDTVSEIAIQWRHVVTDGARKGQHVAHVANAATVPPPVFVPLDDDAMDKWLSGEGL